MSSFSIRKPALILSAAVLALGVSSLATANTGAKFADPDSSTPVANPERGGGFAIEENFVDITTLPGDGWFFQNNSDVPGTTDWFQGNDAVFPAQAGGTTEYIGVNFNSTAGSVISNWMLTPEVNFGTGAELRFYTRVSTGGSIFPDRMEIRLSTSGPSTDVGSTDAAVGDFDTVLTVINPNLLDVAGTCPPGTGGYPEDWCEIVVTNADGLPETGSGRIAFRYTMPDAGPVGSNSNYVGIDTLSYEEGTTAPPGPQFQNVSVNSPWALILMALVLAGVGVVTTRRMMG